MLHYTVISSMSFIFENKQFGPQGHVILDFSCSTINKWDMQISCLISPRKYSMASNEHHNNSCILNPLIWHLMGLLHLPQVQLWWYLVIYWFTRNCDVCRQTDDFCAKFHLIIFLSNIFFYFSVTVTMGLQL